MARTRLKTMRSQVQIPPCTACDLSGFSKCLVKCMYYFYYVFCPRFTKLGRKVLAQWLEHRSVDQEVEG